MCFLAHSVKTFAFFVPDRTGSRNNSKRFKCTIGQRSKRSMAYVARGKFIYIYHDRALHKSEVIVYHHSEHSGPEQDRSAMLWPSSCSGHLGNGWPVHFFGW